jgi:alkylhydroperoxidase/carboxymuconolactone decarboxylase family protein YurZ
MTEKNSNGQGVPAAYKEFIERFPELEQAWDLCRKAEQGGLNDKTLRLLKLAIAVAREAEGATHSAVRKARRAGVSREEMEQVVALAASTIGFPSAVKAYLWVTEVGD